MIAQVRGQAVTTGQPEQKRDCGHDQERRAVRKRSDVVVEAEHRSRHLRQGMQRHRYPERQDHERAHGRQHADESSFEP